MHLIGVGRELNPRHADFQAQPSRADHAIFPAEGATLAIVSQELIKRLDGPDWPFVAAESLPSNSAVPTRLDNAPVEFD